MREQIAETSETLATCKPRIEAAIDDLENCMATYADAGGEGDEDAVAALAALKETAEWT